MKMIVRTEVEGSFEDLFAQAQTGAIINLGHYSCDDWRIGRKGNYLREGNEFFIINGKWEKKSLGTYPHSEWDVSSFGLFIQTDYGTFFRIKDDGEQVKFGTRIVESWRAYKNLIYFRDNNEFFSMDELGRIESLGAHFIDGWTVGPEGIYVQRTSNFYIAKYDEEIRLYFEEKWESWDVNEKGIFLRQNDDFFLIKLESQEKIYLGRQSNCAGWGADQRPDPQGIFFWERDGHDLHLFVIK